MTKLFLMSHRFTRYGSDFSPVKGDRTPKTCPTCERNLREFEPPLLYYWDEEFGNPQVSIEAGHQFFWGSLFLIVTENGRELLENLDLPLDFQPTQPVKTKLAGRELVVEEQPAPVEPLYWARARLNASVDPQRNSNQICAECEKFQTHPRQISRLKVAACAATTAGIFQVRQNRGQPIFVTETIKQRLADQVPLGLGFYAAGKVV